MADLVFKLEKVVRSRSDEMQDFEGPLDLLLFLLGKNRMEIQDISISLICDQYLDWIALRQSMDLDVASEFVAMASHLVYLKTRMLLSMEDEEARSEMDELIGSLEERRRNESYAAVRRMAERLAPLGEFGREIYTRLPGPIEQGKVYEYRQERADLVLAMAGLRSRSSGGTLPSPEAAFREIAKQEPYPVESKAQEILRRLRENGVVRFLLLFLGCRSRSEIVATFLAVLELIRAHRMRLTGPDDEGCVLDGGDGVDRDETDASDASDEADEAKGA